MNSTKHSGAGKIVWTIIVSHNLDNLWFRLVFSRIFYQRYYVNWIWKADNLINNFLLWFFLNRILNYYWYSELNAPTIVRILFSASTEFLGSFCWHQPQKNIHTHARNLQSSNDTGGMLSSYRFAQKIVQVNWKMFIEASRLNWIQHEKWLVLGNSDVNLSWK